MDFNVRGGSLGSQAILCFAIERCLYLPYPYRKVWVLPFFFDYLLRQSHALLFRCNFVSARICTHTSIPRYLYIGVCVYIHAPICLCSDIAKYRYRYISLSLYRDMPMHKCTDIPLPCDGLASVRLYANVQILQYCFV